MRSNVQAARYQKAIHFGYVDFPGSSGSSCPQGECCAGAFQPAESKFPAVGRQAARLRHEPVVSINEQLAPDVGGAHEHAVLVHAAESNLCRVLLNRMASRTAAADRTYGDCEDTSSVVSQLAKAGVTTYVVVPSPGRNRPVRRELCDEAGAGGQRADAAALYRWRRIRPPGALVRRHRARCRDGRLPFGCPPNPGGNRSQ